MEESEDGGFLGVGRKGGGERAGERGAEHCVCTAMYS